MFMTFIGLKTMQKCLKAFEFDAFMLVVMEKQFWLQILTTGYFTLKIKIIIERERGREGRVGGF
ncbi:unnamed protein product [Meloidogyne enterolobii]|uniref:Uncharacterized protein n=1 Tax=Meloidogyne enterolobii TaxID=390850 RepID=A0ACB0YP51_MELEN